MQTLRFFFLIQLLRENFWVADLAPHGKSGPTKNGLETNY